MSEPNGRDIIHGLRGLLSDMEELEFRIETATRELRELLADRTMHPTKMRVQIKEIVDFLENGSQYARGSGVDSVTMNGGTMTMRINGTF